MNINKISFNTIVNSLKELKSRLLFLFFSVFVFRIGTYISIPGLNSHLLGSLLETNNNSFINIFNLFSSGSLFNVSIFSLGLIPYISASIVIQLFTIVFPYFIELKKDGSVGKYKINQYIRYLTFFLSFLQAILISLSIKNLNGVEAVLFNNSSSFYLVVIFSIITGTVFLMWLGEQITDKGIGNGVSVIIFISIISNLPSSISNLIYLIKLNFFSYYKIFIMLSLILFVIYFIVFIEISQRKILVNYATNKFPGSKYFFSVNDIYLPFKINMSGIIPAIFSSSVMVFPYVVLVLLKNIFRSKFLFNFLNFILPGNFLYLFFYTFLVIFFSFFYTLLMYNSKDISNNLKKSGAYITGIRPGYKTSIYIKKVILRLTLFSSLYMSIVCVIPDFMYEIIGLPFHFGGTSLLIVIVVIMEIISQIQTLMMSNRYMNMLKKNSF